MKTIFLGLFLSFFTTYSIAQTECGTSTNFPNTAPSYDQGIEEDISPLCVRVFFHIVRNTAGTNGYNAANIPALMDILNASFSPHNIMIINAGNDEIRNDTYGVEFNDSEFNALTAIQNVANSINIYLLPVEPPTYGGRASGIPGNSLVMGFSLIQTNVLSHELGHCLNLFHTHHQIEIQGCTTGNWSDCGPCSDFVCDTPIDPLLNCGGNVDMFSCNYTGTTYVPDTRNLMSYSCVTCFFRFSDGQGDRMRASLLSIPSLTQVLQANCLSMTGSASICVATPGEVYTIQNAPAGSTFAWSWTNNCPTYTPSGAQCTVTRGNCTGITELTCIVTTPNGNSYEVAKDITLANAPTATSFTPYITHGSNTTYMSSYCNKLTAICGPGGKQVIAPGDPGENVLSPYNYCASGYITDMSATSITWSLVQTSAGTFHGYYNFSGNTFSVGINLNYPNEWLVIRCTRTNACGSFTSDYRFYATKGCMPPPSHCAIYPNDPNCAVEYRQTVTDAPITIFPNPSPGAFTVSLGGVDKDKFIQDIIVTDRMGTRIFNQHFDAKQSSQLIKLNVKISDVYTVRVYDGLKWYTTNVSMVK